MIEFVLDDLGFTPASGDKRAQVVNPRICTQDVVVDRMVASGSGITRSQAIGALTCLMDVLCDITQEGATFTLDILHSEFSITGTFESADSHFERKHHRIVLHIRPRGRLARIVEGLVPQKLPATLSGPVVTGVHDLTTETTDDRLTMGGGMRITGLKMKLDGDDPSVGLYIMPASGEQVKLTKPSILVNKPSEIIAMIPVLTPGACHIKIITQYSGGSKPLKTPHTVVYDRVLILV
jgi:hypothetical protein